MYQSIKDLQSDVTAGINSALSDLQGEIKNPPKSGQNPHFRSTYAKLEDILDYVRPLLSKRGLALDQGTFPYEDGIGIYTRLSKGNEWKTSVHSMKITGGSNIAQAHGAAFKYMRRYQLCAMLGIEGDDDQDGNELTQNTPPNTPPSHKTAQEHRANTQTPTPMANPGEYIAKVKKYQGVKLKDLDPVDVEKYLIYCHENGLNSQGVLELRANFLAIKNAHVKDPGPSEPPPDFVDDLWGVK